jgi:hypothetical protein
MEDGIIQVGNIYPDTDGFKNKTSGRVYSIEGLAPTLNTAHGGANTLHHRGDSFDRYLATPMLMGARDA